MKDRGHKADKAGVLTLAQAGHLPELTRLRKGGRPVPGNVLSTWVRVGVYSPRGGERIKLKAWRMTPKLLVTTREAVLAFIKAVTEDRKGLVLTGRKLFVGV